MGTNSNAGLNKWKVQQTVHTSTYQYYNILQHYTSYRVFLLLVVISTKALKILLSPEDLISTSTSRDDVVALVNVLWKMSDALEVLFVLSPQLGLMNKTVRFVEL